MYKINRKIIIFNWNATCSRMSARAMNEQACARWRWRSRSHRHLIWNVILYCETNMVICMRALHLYLYRYKMPYHRVIKTQPMDLRCDYSDCATIMLIWLAGYWQRTIAKRNIEWSTQANHPSSQPASQPDKEMKWQKEHNNNNKKKHATDGIRLAQTKDMRSFLIPQRHTHKCMFNKTKINCPMSAIAGNAIAI